MRARPRGSPSFAAAVGSSFPEFFQIPADVPGYFLDLPRYAGLASEFLLQCAVVRGSNSFVEGDAWMISHMRSCPRSMLNLHQCDEGHLGEGVEVRKDCENLLDVSLTSGLIAFTQESLCTDQVTAPPVFQGFRLALIK